VPRVLDSGDGRGYVEFMLGHLAGDKIIIVITGDGYKHVGSAGADFLQSAGLTAISPEYHVSHILGDQFAPFAVAFDDQYLVTFGEKYPGQIVADFTATGNDDIHVNL